MAKSGTDINFPGSYILSPAQGGLGASTAWKVRSGGSTAQSRACTCMHPAHARIHTHTCTPRTYLNREEAPPELFPIPFSKALLVAKQQGGLLPREWDGREGMGGGRWEEKEPGMSGHPRWGLPAIPPTLQNTYSPHWPQSVQSHGV